MLNCLSFGEIRVPSILVIGLLDISIFINEQKWKEEGIVAN